MLCRTRTSAVYCSYSRPAVPNMHGSAMLDARESTNNNTILAQRSAGVSVRQRRACVTLTLPALTQPLPLPPSPFSSPELPVRRNRWVGGSRAHSAHCACGSRSGVA
eukprot:scaffold185518_cov36-Tisochrysis_lutea.AAC.1